MYLSILISTESILALLILSLYIHNSITYDVLELFYARQELEPEVADSRICFPWHCDRFCKVYNRCFNTDLVSVIFGAHSSSVTIIWASSYVEITHIFHSFGFVYFPSEPWLLMPRCSIPITRSTIQYSFLTEVHSAVALYQIRSSPASSKWLRTSQIMLTLPYLTSAVFRYRLWILTECSIEPITLPHAPHAPHAPHGYHGRLFALNMPLTMFAIICITIESFRR